MEDLLRTASNNVDKDGRVVGVGGNGKPGVLLVTVRLDDGVFEAFAGVNNISSS